MTELERLEVDDVIEINAELCAETGENSVCLDRAGLEAAVERPWAGFGHDEFYPTLCGKAAALLHGLASRQIFENGNKRTAWTAAVAFLDVNGVDVGRVATVQSDMFVRAAALDHSLDIADLAEWFEVVVEQNRVDQPYSHSLQRLPILSVGTVSTREDSGLEASGWTFGSPWLPAGTEIPVAEGTLGGWTAVELHAIAHGAPCDCPIGRAHSGQGWV